MFRERKLEQNGWGERGRERGRQVERERGGGNVVCTGLHYLENCSKYFAPFMYVNSRNTNEYNAPSGWFVSVKYL